MAPLFSALILGGTTLAAQDTVPAPDSPGAPRLLDRLQDGTPPPPAPPKPPFIVAPEHIRDTKSIQQGGRTYEPPAFPAFPGEDASAPLTQPPSPAPPPSSSRAMPPPHPPNSPPSTHSTIV